MKITRISDQVIKTNSSVETFAMDILMGLCSTPKKISAKYFYDDKGSELFQQITKQKDYYPTKAEFEILDKIKDQLPESVHEKEIDLIELGAGDGHKSQLVIEGFLRQGIKVNFYPIDISEKAMDLLEVNIKKHENLTMHGVVGEYFEGLRFARENSNNRAITLFLGSNIGNFDRIQNQVFLRKFWKSMKAGDFALIGFDLKKDIDRLLYAYNDRQGFTEKFNLNLLTRINSELGGEFELENFNHYGTYNPLLGAMESYLISIKSQDVYIKELERTFHFDAFEGVHLEYSFKFLESDIDFLAKNTGFEVLKHFSDEGNLFVNSLWQVKK